MKRLLTNQIRPKVLIIGPTPQVTGGIALFIKNLLEQKILLENYDIEHYKTGKKNAHTKSPLQAMIEIYRVIMFLKKSNVKNVNIFYIHTASYLSFFRNFLYILIAHHLKKGKVIVHIHGGEFHIFFNSSPKIIKYIIKYALNSSDCLIVTSPSWIKIIKAISNNDNILSIPNGFDHRIFYPISKEIARNRLKLSFDKKILLAIGHLERFKGHEYLIRSVEEIVKYKNNIILYIIGSGSLKEHLQDIICSSNLSEHVILAGGNKPQEEISLWMNAADLFILPSLNEGNPTVMFEALSIGLPFIGTKVGGVPDIINSDNYGMLCEPGNTEDLKETILLAINKEWDRETIIDYSKQFRWGNIACSLSDIFKNI